jgi:hypothetical protein
VHSGGRGWAAGRSAQALHCLIGQVLGQGPDSGGREALGGGALGGAEPRLLGKS